MIVGGNTIVGISLCACVCVFISKLTVADNLNKYNQRKVVNNRVTIIAVDILQFY